MTFCYSCSMDIPQTRRSFYHLFRRSYPLQFQMASISPSSYPLSLQMAFVSPFPLSHCWYSTMWVQISGHSSVQSSSTFGLRKASQPIYIRRSKKIEQGQLLYPKICPPIFFKVLTSIISICSSLLKGYTVNHSPKPVKLGFWFLQRKLRFSRAQSSPTCSYTLSSTYMSSFKAHKVKLHSQKP